MAEKLNMTSTKPAHTPMEPGSILATIPGPEARLAAPYLEAVGSLLSPTMVSRPDILFAVGTLAQFNQHPAETHWKAVKHVIAYLYTTRDLWLTIGGQDASIKGFVDADWASQDHRRSVSGFAFQMGGRTVTWFSKKQPIVALSSTEAEYIAATHTPKEVHWVRLFLAELNITVEEPIILNCNNQSAITLTKDNIFHTRTKHIDI